MITDEHLTSIEIDARNAEWMDSWASPSTVLRLCTELRRLREWHPIESAPRDGTEILLWGDGDTAAAYWHAETGKWMVARGLMLIFRDPTHWRPLPDPPREGVGG